MGSDRRIHGFADLHFAQSAHLALARAGESAGTDIEVQHASSFAVDERHLQVSIDVVASQVEIDGFKRLLEALVRDATSGEASLEVETGERWAERARPGAAGGKGGGTDVLSSGTHALGPHASGAHASGPHASGTSELDESETRPTLRTDAG